MNFLDQALQQDNIFLQQWYLFSNGGWIVVVLVLAWAMFFLYMDEIQAQFLAQQEWVFLNIKIPKSNQLSTLAVEQVFTQMHALATTITFPQRYMEGKVMLWYSLEIVSLGGKISFIIRTPKRVKDLVEAAFYAHYPNAEISEVEDYLANLEYDHHHHHFDLFGFEFKLESDFTLPIKTYKEFEHPTAEEKIVDPLKPLFESLAAVKPHELYAIQILIRPLADDDWKPKGEEKAKKLIAGEEKEESRFSILHFLLDVLASLWATAEEGGHAVKEEKERTFMNLSDIEKETVNGVLRKVGKPGYQTKIRHLYLAPPDKLDGNMKALPIGSYRTLGNANTNKLKPDTKETWTAKDYKLSFELERPYLDWIIEKRKHHFWSGFTKRSMWIGLPPYILNVEELATLYHLPLIPEDTISFPSIEAVESKKSQPPANLPIGEY